MVGLVVSALTKEDYRGQEITAGQMTGEALIPLAPKDIIDVMQEDYGIPRKLAESVLILHGIGVQVHEEKKRSSGRF